MAEPKARVAVSAIREGKLAPAGGADTIALREMALRGYLNLRVDPRDHAAIAGVSSVIGTATLPLEPNSWLAASGLEMLWQAYDEWLLVTSDGTQAALVSTLSHALRGSHCAVTDVSDQRAAFELQGPHARDVLQKGCAVDLHPRVFGANACVQTALARVRVTLRRMNDASTYEVLVERSYAQYLWEWLNDAAVEYHQASA